MAAAGSSPSASPNTRSMASARSSAAGVSTSIQRTSPTSQAMNSPRRASARTPSDSEQSPNFSSSSASSWISDGPIRNTPVSIAS